MPHSPDDHRFAVNRRAGRWAWLSGSLVNAALGVTAFAFSDLWAAGPLWQLVFVAGIVLGGAGLAFPFSIPAGWVIEKWAARVAPSPNAVIVVALFAGCVTGPACIAASLGVVILAIAWSGDFGGV